MLILAMRLAGGAAAVVSVRRPLAPPHATRDADMQATDVPSNPSETVTIRTSLRPGDIGAVIHLHGTVYAREYGFDHTFEAYVAGPLAAFARAGSDRERLWLAEREGRIVGCVAIVTASPTVAQLRWFLVAPDVRGAGLGRRLLDDAIAFCRARDYESIVLWTVSALEAAAHLYHATGFRKVEEKPGRMWGVDVVEERYELSLRHPRSHHGT